MPRAREHVEGLDVAARVGPREEPRRVPRLRRRLAGHVDDPPRREGQEPPEEARVEARARRVDDNDGLRCRALGESVLRRVRDAEVARDAVRRRVPPRARDAADVEAVDVAAVRLGDGDGEESYAAVRVDGDSKARAAVDDVADEQIRDARVDLEKVAGLELVGEPRDASRHARLRRRGHDAVLREPEQRRAPLAGRARRRVGVGDLRARQQARVHVHERAAPRRGEARSAVGAPRRQLVPVARLRVRAHDLRDVDRGVVAADERRRLRAGSPGEGDAPPGVDDVLALPAALRVERQVLVLAAAAAPKVLARRLPAVRRRPLDGEERRFGGALLLLRDDLRRDLVAGRRAVHKDNEAIVQSDAGAAIAEGRDLQRHRAERATQHHSRALRRSQLQRSIIMATSSSFLQHGIQERRTRQTPVAKR